jgi:hypothetical protein
MAGLRHASPVLICARSHFHHGYDAPPQPCTNCAIQQADYDSSVGRVQTCDLGGLPDLDTGNTHVQQVYSRCS